MKQIKVYQIRHDDTMETHNRRFCSMRMLKNMRMEFDFSYYEEVFNGEMDIDTAEQAYMRLQGHKPNGYKGHSLSVSDIVFIDGKYLFCDSFDFKDVTDKIR